MQEVGKESRESHPAEKKKWLQYIDCNSLKARLLTKERKNGAMNLWFCSESCFLLSWFLFKARMTHCGSDLDKKRID